MSYITYNPYKTYHTYPTCHTYKTIPTIPVGHPVAHDTAAITIPYLTTSSHSNRDNP